MNATGADQSELIGRCLAGDEAACHAIYQAHAGRVKAYFRRSGFWPSDADDLTQETFARVFRSLAGFDPDRGGFATWLAAIARNVARRAWTRRPQPDDYDPELAEEVLAAADNPGRTAEEREEMTALEQCLVQLPAELAKIVRLRYVDGLTTRGLAIAVDLPEATVRLRLGQAVAMIGRCLKGKGVVE